MQTKDLMLNGILLAKYQYEGRDLWLKPYVYFPGTKKRVSEDILILLISQVEKTVFNRVAYLNI